MSETWQLASFSDYDHSLEALNCVKKQKMKNEQKDVSFINDRSVWRFQSWNISAFIHDF